MKLYNKQKLNISKSVLFSWIFGIFIFFCLLEFVPSPACNDGWMSSSIGRQGACSHHGGVKDDFGIKLILFLISVFIGIGIYSLVQKVRNWKNKIQQYLRKSLKPSDFQALKDYLFCLLIFSILFYLGVYCFDKKDVLPSILETLNFVLFIVLLTIFLKLLHVLIFKLKEKRHSPSRD